MAKQAPQWQQDAKIHIDSLDNDALLVFFTQIVADATGEFSTSRDDWMLQYAELVLRRRLVECGFLSNIGV